MHYIYSPRTLFHLYNDSADIVSSVSTFKYMHVCLSCVEFANITKNYNVFLL